MTCLFSAIQPTGKLHLGNYLGAIKNFVDIQDQYDKSLFCIADLHAITMPQDPGYLRKATHNTIAACMACGIHHYNIFPQSAVPEHAELAWILGTLTPMGWLNRMTQFKDKSEKQNCLGLYSYPVLMAADILLYKATHVPVGDDQKQHLELARDIAAAFNRQYDTDFFPLPEPLITGEATRVMSLRDGRKKMSKSDKSDFSRINIGDSNDVIADKIKKAKTDSESDWVCHDPINRPEVSNLIAIYAAIKGESIRSILNDFSVVNIKLFKSDLTDLLINHLEPINKKYNELMQDIGYLNMIWESGRRKVSDIASDNISDIKHIIGL